ncbi:hypothetical protein Hanom_Chr08g00718231 [Helianthus anomalus]
MRFSSPEEKTMEKSFARRNETMRPITTDCVNSTASEIAINGWRRINGRSRGVILVGV